MINYTENAYLIKPRYNMLLWDIVLRTPQQFHTYRHIHGVVINMETFPALLAFVRGIHRSPVNFPHKGQWCGASVFSLICAYTNSKQSRRRWFETPSRSLLKCHDRVLGFNYDCSGVNWWSYNRFHSIFTCESLTVWIHSSPWSRKPVVVVDLHERGDFAIWKVRRKTAFNSLAPERFERNLRKAIFKLILIIVGWGIFFVKLPSDECQWTLLMISQHWFR